MRGISNEPPDRRRSRSRRSRFGFTTLVAAAGLVMATLPATAANNGTIWTTLADMPTARYGPASATAACPPAQGGNCVYTVGGTNGTRATGAAESYNRLSGAWSTLPPMPTPRSQLGAATAPCPKGQQGYCVYAVGGVGGAGGLTKVESYNPATNAWSTVAALSVARYNTAATAAPCPAGQTGTCVYAVGGTTSGGNTASVESYNPVTNAWSPVASLPLARGGLGAAASTCPRGQTGTCVYAVGGNAGGPVGTVESYNPATNVWTPVAALPTPRFTLATVAAPCPPGQTGTCVYAVGGLNGGLTGKVESYQPSSNTWTTLPSLPTPRSFLAAAATHCPPGITGACVYVSGGSASSGPSSALEALDPPTLK
ncbi:Kelch repeat-containing protein [Streptomyces sp. NPDC014870]|uniref:Kelch repeat-containing protein n=1 Tax=Streptomyces sp. NPDC014870 TaxID=3364925 RepID=UPI0036FFEDD1